MGVKTAFQNFFQKTTLALVAIITFVGQISPISSAFAAAPANPGSLARVEIGGNPTAITDANGDTNTVTVTFSHGTITATGTNLYSDNSYVIYALGDLTITATADPSYAADLIENGSSIHSNTKTYTGLTAGSYHRIDGDFTQPPTHATINYDHGTTEPADISINGVMLNPGDTGLDYTYDGTGNVTISLETFATLTKLKTVTINSVPYSVPADDQLLNLVDGQTLHYNFTVPYSATYNIATTTEAFTPENSIVGSFLWSYLDEDKDNDNYFGNGSIELVKIMYNNTDVTNQVSPDGHGYLQWGEFNDGKEGGAMLPVGAVVTVKMLPKAGYQLTRFTVNGVAAETGSEIGVYTFTITGGNFHFSAHFSKVDDAVSSTAEAVTSGTITLGNGEIANGTARLDVSDATGLTDADLAGFEESASGYNVKTILDISLFKTIFKGTEDESWDTQIDELNHEATITLQLDENVDGNEIVIVHQKHDGSYEVIPTTYDAANHTITFKTSSFSNYAIASRTIKSPDTGAFTSNESSAIQVLPILSMLVAVISLAVLMIKKNAE